ncbi:MAG: hypothetical protein L0216_19455, partial [Planctomycetales bacterium]|nr:hypothetical protein [Planctomycetales bacterium]
MATALALVWLGHTAASDADTALLLLAAGVLVIAVGATLAAALITNRLDVFSPFTVISLTFAVSYGLGGAYLLRGRGLLQARFRDVLPVLGSVLLLAWLGWLGFAAGYWAGSRRFARPTSRVGFSIGNRASHLRLWLVCFVLSWAARIVLVRNGVYLQSATPTPFVREFMGLFGLFLPLGYLALGLA